MLLMSVGSLCLLSNVGEAYAAEQSERPSVLVVDAGLGDYELAGLHWLGSDTSVVAEESNRVLTTSENPAWWAARGEAEPGGNESGDTAAVGASAPATFLLGSPTDAAITADGIVWALDKIRESGVEPRTFVLGVGPSALALREYAEDLANTKQSARADIVGMGFCGTPQGGYSAIATYPEQDLWGRLAQVAGISLEDLEPQSDYLKRLNEGAFPRVVKALSVAGAVGDLGFGRTDGAGVVGDFALPESVSDQVVLAQVSTTISRQLNLTSYWQPFTSSINYADRSIDAQLAERLSAMDGYEVSGDVQALVRDFYDAWFANGAPVTHNSNVLLIDLSGSMVEVAGDGANRLTAAKNAAAHYLQAMRECGELPQSAPMDVSVFGFNETLAHVTSGYDQASVAALEDMTAYGETNIGLALGQALTTLRQVPTCADKHILLLSDGEATRGMSDGEMLVGPVAEASAAGIRIDVIGFGDVGESDTGFLKNVAAATGGTYYQANDTYSLKVNFLKSYYSSLGLGLVDEEINVNDTAVQVIGAVDDRTSALALGVVANGSVPSVKLLCDGEELDESLYTVQQEGGFTSIQSVGPRVGNYELELSGASGAAHVFAVKQQGIAQHVDIVGEQVDYSLYFLIGAGALLVLAVIVVIIVSSRKSSSKGEGGGAR